MFTVCRFRWSLSSLSSCVGFPCHLLICSYISVLIDMRAAFLTSVPNGQSIYRMGVDKLLYLMEWSRPEIANAVRELSRYMKSPGLPHLKVVYRVMNYCLNTPNRRKLLTHDSRAHPNWREFCDYRFIEESGISLSNCGEIFDPSTGIHRTKCLVPDSLDSIDSTQTFIVDSSFSLSVAQ